jgi:hypothetical protein
VRTLLLIGACWLLCSVPAALFFGAWLGGKVEK